MKKIIALIAFTVTSLVERLLAHGETTLLQPLSNAQPELTEEIRRYDIDDLILS